MWETNLTGANLIRANFKNAKLVEVKLCDAKLNLANFDSTVLWKVDFLEQSLKTRLLNARIEDCVSDGAE